MKTPVAVTALLALAACSKPPQDSLCSYDPAPATLNLTGGKGAIQIAGKTDEYFYVLDSAGKQLTNAKLGQAAPVAPGRYEVRLNRSSHPVTVEAKTITRCASGSILASGTTDEYFYVFDGANTQLASQKIGRALDLFPGKYKVELNRTSQAVEIAAGAMVELKPATLTVEGSTDEYYYVFDSSGTQLASTKISRPLALLPGAWTVKVNGTSQNVNAAAGATLKIPTAVLVITGTTDEYYYVLNSTGTQLASTKLGRPLGFMPGSYTAKVNNSTLAVQLEAGKTAEYATATLTVKAAKDAYYYVLDTSGTQLGSTKINQPMALFAGSYSVKVDQASRPVTLTASQPTLLNW